MSRAPLILRTALAGDRGAVLDLLEVLQAVETPIAGDRLPPRAAAEAYYEALQHRLAAQEGRLVAAVIEEQVVGLMGFVVEEDEVYVAPEVRRRGFVTDLVVHEDWRGHGIGRALIAEAERLTLEKGLRRLALGVVAGNTRAERAYAAWGFRPAATILVKPLR